MATITASEFKNLIQTPDISDTNMEIIIDQAINSLNARGADLSNMSGTAGSKTWSGESKEKGAIYEVTRLIYYGFYKGIETTAIAGLSVSPSDILSNPAMQQVIDRLAHELTEMDVNVA